MCIQLDILYNTDTFRHEKCGGAADINLAAFQHPDHSTPGTVLDAVSPAIRDFETYPVV